MPDAKPGGEPRDHVRSTLVQVAARMIAEQGPGAVTTRAVAQAAGVQAPTIYRFFGDKDGLLDAVAEHVLATWVADKARVADTDDAVADLRVGWDLNVGFGLANPAVFGMLTYPGRATRSPAAAAGLEVLRARVHRVAAAGRLRVAEPRAVQMIQAAATGAVITLLSVRPQDRDLTLADAVYGALTRAILTDAPAPVDENATGAAVTFRTVVPRLDKLSDAERTLLSEWLDRTSTS